MGTAALLASALGGLSAPSQAAQVFIDHTDELNVTGPFSSSEETHRFYGNSIITLNSEQEALAGEASFDINAGLIRLYDNSVLNAFASNTIKSGYAHFFDRSVLNLGAENAMSGTATIQINNHATINASDRNAISDGSLYASDDTILNATAENAISGGNHAFFDRAVVNATAQHALSGGQLTFTDNNTLNAVAEYALDGAAVMMLQDSILNLRASHAFHSGYAVFGDRSTLNADAEHAIDGGTFDFYNTTALHARVKNAVSGGNMTFAGDSALNASVSGAVNNANGEFTFTTFANLNATTPNAVERANIFLSWRGAVNVKAANALSSNVNLTFTEVDWIDPNDNDPRLKLEGVSTTVGAINSAVHRLGRIENSGPTNAVLTVDSSTQGDSFFSGTIENGTGGGTLGLVKTGAGTLTLSGNHTYTDNTTVNGGKLALDAVSLVSDINVQNGGTLSGTGTIANATIASGGTLAPGKGVAMGTLLVNGDLTFEAGSQYHVYADPDTNVSSVTHVAGTAKLAGSTMHIGPDSNYEAFGVYTILTANTLQGKSDAVSSKYAFLKPILKYDVPNHVVLTLDRNSTAFADLALTPNQTATAHGLESVPQDSDLYKAVAGITEEEAPGAFDNLSG